ncbi:HdeD family acid-resistance protein [Ktedonobacter robiniae]|uniref:Membrane protein n=1 Tax=Ktedonobacter robiniae TaxID=2778365 RepID=A0ABQ3UGU7_9CHLR|nr:HdeD family acid-resistance protein [Ktedonobacter robiniae]GHO51903.1 membrane protein [Ktedonobacter robiniae]
MQRTDDFYQGAYGTMGSTWLMAIRGVVAIIFGIAALLWPGRTLLILVYLFGAFAIVDGILAAVASVQLRHLTNYWWIILLEGIFGIIIGIASFALPGVTALALLFLVAIWAILTGILELVSAFSGRAPVRREWAMGIAGVLSIVLGILLIAQPRAGLLTLVWLIGIYAIAWGFTLFVRAFQHREPHSRMPGTI